MDLFTLLILGCLVIVAIGAIVVAFSTRRSVWLLWLGPLIAIVCAGLAYYAYVESNSTAWACGYAVVGGVLIASTAINWIGSRSSSN